MNTVKRILGVLAMILGVLGVILSVAFIVGAWVVNARLTDASLAVLGSVDEALVVVDSNVDQVDQSLADFQDRVSETFEPVQFERLNETAGDLLALVESAETSLSTTSSLISAAKSVPFLGGSEAESSTDTLDEVTTTLTQVADGLASLEERTAVVREESVIASEINSSVDEVRGLVQGIGARIGRVQLAVTSLQTNVPRWLDMGAAALTFFLVWVGVAQASLFAHGREWFRRPAEAAAEELPAGQPEVAAALAVPLDEEE
jgi:methyl-accepting chemotaxis protein